jgi:hypothetical protein
MGWIRKDGMDQEGWDGSGRMRWIRKDGMDQEGWDGSGRMGWMRKDGMDEEGWDGSGRMGWIRKDGMDQEGEQVARGAYNLAEVIFRQDDGDLIKAEGLARESVRIQDQLYCAHDRKKGVNYLLLAKILLKQGEFGDETKELFERSLAIYVRNEGPDGVNTSCANIEIGRFHYEFAMVQSTTSSKRAQLQLAKSYSEEAIRIESKIHNPSHPNSIGAASLWSYISNEL